MASIRAKSVAEPRAAAGKSGRKPKAVAALAKPTPAVARKATKAAKPSGELSEIVARISQWAGGPRQALAWCREVGIPALGGLTAAELVAAGKGRSVLAFLDHIAVGGFA